MNWYFAVLKKYAEFSGRAQRMEYWMFVLFNTLILIALGIIEGAAGAGAGMGPLSLLYSLAVFLPGIAVSVRRLHDTDRSGWWVLISLVPIIGLIAIIILMALDGTPGDNRFGPNPKIAVASS